MEIRIEKVILRVSRIYIDVRVGLEMAGGK